MLDTAKQEWIVYVFILARISLLCMIEILRWSPGVVEIFVHMERFTSILCITNIYLFVVDEGC